MTHLQRVEKIQITNFYTLVRLRESEINFVFCEWELYVGTAPEQKTKSAKSGLNVMFKPLFYKSDF